MARFEVGTNRGDPISASGWATGNDSQDGLQRHVRLFVGRDEVSICVYGHDETRQLMKALASASGGLLATLPDEYGPLDERDEAALAEALLGVQGDHASTGGES